MDEEIDIGFSWQTGNRFVTVMIDPYVFKSNSQLTIDKKLLITSRHIGARKICAIILDGAIKHIDIIKKEHYYESFPTQIKTMNDYPLVTVFV